MPGVRSCPQCSKPLPADAPEGLCAACLLATALAESSVTRPDNTGDWSTPSSIDTISPSAGIRLHYVGDYELLTEIARGGMGIVWRARQISLNRIVAVKLIRAGSLASEDDVNRFHREAEAAANLQHPNIVAIHEVGEYEGQHYFSMDYVAGLDLAAKVQNGPLSMQRAARYVQIIAEAIHFAHQRGTLHRDLKPQNVLIDVDDQPRITDFGLAKFTDDESSLTQTGIVMGSPSYMPPEQASGDRGEIGPHSDVYSLGAILYELLTARPPFQGATPMATLRAVMETEPVAPCKLNANVSVELETICLKCLDKRPNMRYHSARELADDLTRFLKQEPILARRASVVRRASSWVRRHPGVLALLATMVMIGLAFSGFYLFEENRFLRAQHSDASLVRQPAKGAASMETWSSLFSMLYLGGLLVMLAVARNKQRIPWNDLFRVRSSLFKPEEPMTERMQKVATCAGLVLITFGLAFTVRLIQVQVWEETISVWRWTCAFAAVWLGAWLVGSVIQDHRRANYGWPTRHLAAEQVKSIEHALAEGDFVEAIRLYRRSEPEAGRDEAINYVRRLAGRTQGQPFRPRPFSFADLNWPAVLICAAIEISVVFAALFAMPSLASNRGLAFDFSGGFLLGISLLIAVRFAVYPARPWHRLALLLLVVVLVGWRLLRAQFIDQAEGSSPLGWPYAMGVAFGVSLMMSAFQRRRRQV